MVGNVWQPECETNGLEEESGQEPSYQASSPSSSDPLPPARLHLLKVPKPSETVPPTGGPSVQTQGCMGDTSHSNHTTA